MLCVKKQPAIREVELYWAAIVDQYIPSVFPAQNANGAWSNMSFSRNILPTAVICCIKDFVLIEGVAVLSCSMWFSGFLGGHSGTKTKEMQASTLPAKKIHIMLWSGTPLSDKINSSVKAQIPLNEKILLNLPNPPPWSAAENKPEMYVPCAHHIHDANIPVAIDIGYKAIFANALSMLKERTKANNANPNAPNMNILRSPRTS